MEKENEEEDKQYVVMCNLNEDIYVESERQLKGDIILGYINSHCYKYMGFGPYPPVVCEQIDCGISGCK
jgi:hypothetical protein